MVRIPSCERLSASVLPFPGWKLRVHLFAFPVPGYFSWLAVFSSGIFYGSGDYSFTVPVPLSIVAVVAMSSP